MTDPATASGVIATTPFQTTFWSIFIFVGEVWLCLGFIGAIFGIMAEYYKFKEEKRVISFSILDAMKLILLFIGAFIVATVIGAFTFIAGFQCIYPYIKKRLAPLFAIKTFFTRDRFVMDFSDKPKGPSKQQQLESEIASQILN